MAVVRNHHAIKIPIRAVFLFSFAIALLIFLRGGSVYAQTSVYPTDASKYISVSKNGNGIYLDAPVSIIKIKFSGDTKYMKVFIIDGQFHDGVDAGSPPTNGRAGDTIFQICGSNNDGSKNADSCTAGFDAASFDPFQPLNVQDSTAVQSYAAKLSIPVDADGYRSIYVLAKMKESGLNGFKVAATGYSNAAFTTETGYTRVGFGATQGAKVYNMSLVNLPLDGDIKVSPAFNLNFTIPCGNVDRFNLQWYDADRYPSETPLDKEIKYRIRNETTGQEISSDELAFYSGQNPNAFLGGDNESRTQLIANSILMRVRSGDRFSWIWEDVKGNNGVQFALPYSESDADIKCNTPPVSSFAPNCLNISVESSDGDFAAGPNWSLESDNKVILNGRGNGVYNIPDTFYAKKDHSITLVTYDVNSAGINIGGGVRSAAKTLTCEKFELTPTTSVQLLPDDESPDTANFGGGATRTTGTITVKGVNIFRAYYYIKNYNPAGGNTENQLGAAPIAATNQPIGTFNFTTDLSRPLTGLGLVAGDCVRQSVTVSPNSGVVDANGNIVKRYSDKNDRNCVDIVNRPYVSFYGGDVNTCGEIKTFYDNGAGRKRGSGVQYIAQAKGTISIDGFISGSLLGGLPNRLTFANTTGPYGGSLGGTCSVPGDYFSGAPTAAEPPTSTIIDPGTLTSGSKLYKAPTGGIELKAGNLQDSSRTALYIDGDLRITGDIGYANSTWSNETKIPSLHVYVKGNIYIQPNVTNLTGFFVAQQKVTTDDKGNIFTCANGNVRVTTNLLTSCALQLSVRGAFSSKRTYFDRVANSLRNGTIQERIGTPQQAFINSKAAEKFYIGPEMYFVSPGASSTGGGTSSGDGYQFITTPAPIL